MRRCLRTSVILFVVAFGGVAACSDRYEHVPSAVERTATATNAAATPPPTMDSSRLEGTKPTTADRDSTADPMCYGSRLTPCLSPSPELAGLVTEPDCLGTGRRICIAPVGSIAPDLISYLVADAHDRLGLTVNVLPAIIIPDNLVDSSRGQVKAVALEKLVEQRYPADYGTVIALTSADFYPETEPDLPFYFGARWGHGNDRWRGILSMARMNPVFFGQPQNDGLLKDRLRKMFTGYVAKLYYGYPDSSTTTFATYGPVTGLTALDKMSDKLPPESAPCFGTGPRVCIVPFGDSDVGALTATAATFQAEYGLRVDVLSHYAPKNGQNLLDGTYDSAVLRTELASAYPRLGEDPDVVLIGVTSDGLFSAALLPADGASLQPGGNRILAETGAGCGVITTKAPDGSTIGAEALRKLIDQQIALLYFHVPADPTLGAPLHSPVQTLAQVAGMPVKAAPPQ